MTDLPVAAISVGPADPGRLAYRFVRDPKACAGAAIVVLLVAIAALAPVLAPYPYDDTDLLAAWVPPSSAHWIGTDKLGRDILSRLLFGARTSLLVSVSVLGITLTVGMALGMLAGYLGGWVDSVVSRLADIVFAFPDVVFAILVAAVLGPSMLTVIVALSIVWWPGVARLTRALVLVQRNETFVEAAVVCGTPVARILVRHILPNIVPPLIVRASIGIGFIIMSEATLSLLGLGVQEPQPSWGSMIRDGLEALRTDPYLALSGSAMLAVTIIGFNLLGDGLRDLLDPKLAGSLR
ncbi:MAG TPA: ABC transporter permease [Xanthobacteraceae bacterium]|jgi:ABC-type dipeptide/oligopeptide/nickel transport system permease subunit